ncbi:MAG: SDR family NAD(P)-dependent oxidoreductase [Streptosporangiales bacterium]|nr:SDR family NAD(P)-dependent oxidoreductase [Streptosporangiales bacterium]
MSAQTILITGATDGLGSALAREVAGLGANVLLHGRDSARVEAMRQEISEATGKRELRCYVADLADLAQVRRLAEEITQTCDRLDVLVNNAGIGGGPRDRARRETSRDGYELRFAVNYLASFLLTETLLPLLDRSGSGKDAPARVVNVASVGQAPIDFDDVMLERGYDSMRAYAQSKLAMITWGFDLAERCDPARVTVNSLHPATLMDTKMVTEWFGYTMSTVAEGTEATLRLVTAEELDGVTGRYFDGKREARADAQAYDPAARRRLRELSERLTGTETS